MRRLPAGAVDAAALAALGAALAAWSWRRWADVWVDFGFELELARRLSRGEVLYRDIVYKNGPLSPYSNALLFRLFGDHADTVTAANLAAAALTAFFLYKAAARGAGPAGAFAAAAAFLTVFAFNQYVVTANYTFIAPYSHCQTHGVVLGLALVLCWGSWLERPRLSAAVGGGFLLGLLFLTKAELFVPGAAVAALALASAARRGAAAARPALSAAAAALLPPAAAAFLLARRLPWAEALRGTAGNWAAPVHPLSNPFYLWCLGLDRPAARAAGLVGGAVLLAGVVGWALFLDRRLGGRPLPALAALLVFHAAAAALLLPLLHVGPALLAAAVVLAALGATRLLRREGERLPAWDLGSVFALALMGKLGLNPRVEHYGFALAMPAAALTAAFLVGRLPRLAGGGAVLRWSLSGVLLAVGAAFLGRSASYYGPKTVAVGAGRDVFMTDGGRGAAFARLLAATEAAVPPGATLLVLPEGAMLNFLSGRRNPTPYSTFFPEDLRLYGGEDAVVARLGAQPPDFVALVPRNMAEYGVGPFGGRLASWVRARYAEVYRDGDNVLLRRD